MAPVAEMKAATTATDALIKTAAPSEVAVPHVVEKVFVMREPQPEVNVNDELDAFYARMAKIRLEKHQLDDALVLIQKIKSETFKVRTIVSLAEYVSRDKSFESEADQLFRLAITSMEALERRQPPVRTGVEVPRPAGPLPIIDTPPEPAPELAPEPAPVQEPPHPPPVSPADVFPPSDPGSQPLIPLVDPPGVSPTTTPPTGRPIIWLEDDARNNNGRQPPPPAPRGNGVDGIVTTPPGSQHPTETPVIAPPANTKEDNGLIPPPPQVYPDPPVYSPPQTIQQDSPPFVRPDLPTIPLDDNNGRWRVPSPATNSEAERPTQTPPTTRRTGGITLDEN